MKRKPDCLRLIGLFLILSLTALPLLAHAEGAGDVDPQGVKLRALLKGKAQAPANTDWRIVCNIEMGTALGYGIWMLRLGTDPCQYECHSPLDYCIYYSKHCNHYIWDSKCLSSHGGCPTHDKSAKKK